MEREPRSASVGGRIRSWARIWGQLALLCGLLWLGLAAWGQSAVDGAIAGHVVDMHGGAIPGAKVVVANVATGVASVLSSGADGAFLAVRMAPGEYQVTITAPGFESVMEAATVELGTTASVDARLSLGQVNSTVTVNAADAEDAEEVGSGLDRVYGSSELETLPLDGSRWQSFALLMPGVNDGGEGDGEGAVSFRGAATTQNSSQIDGVSNDQSFGGIPVGTGAGAGPEAEEEADSGGESGVGGDGARQRNGRHAGAAYTFSQAAVQEFEVHAANYSALDGRAAGGVVTTVSKSGSEALRGTVSYTLRDSAWAAANPFSIASSYQAGVVSSGLVKPQDLRQQFVGTVGGPLLPRRLKRKLFYFLTSDQQRRNFPAISSPEYPEFYQLTAMQEALLANRGVSAAKTQTALNYLSSLSGPVARESEQGINFGKLDWQASPKNRISLQDNRVRWSSPAGAQGGAVIDRGMASLGNAYGKVDAGVLRWVAFWNSHLSNEMRLGYSRDFEYETAQTPLPQEPAIGPGGYAPEVSIAPQGFTFGTPAALGRLAYPDEHSSQAAELLAWVHGHHLLQVGADFSYVQDTINALSNQDGTFHYDSGATNGKAGGLVDWITDYTFNENAYPNGGCPSITAKEHLFCFRTFTQSFGEQAIAFTTQEWAGYVQDAWRLGKGLDINLGVRYEYQFEPLPQQPNLALDAVFGAVGATNVIPEDRNNVGPRVGLAWEPIGRGRGMVRMGYGVYYGRLPGATIRSALADTAMPNSTTSIRITPATETVCPQASNQGFGYVCDYTGTPPAAVSATTTAMVFDKHFQLPMVQQGSFGLEREVGAGITAGATYVMNMDRQLPNSVDINIAPSTGMGVFQLQGGPANGSGPLGVTNGETFVVPIYTTRVSTNYGPVTDIVSNTNATYNALVLEARKHSRRGLEFRANWSWAKAIDYGQNNSAVPHTNGQFDPFTIRYDRGLSTLNVAHKITVAAMWEPTVAMPEHWLREAANGWSIAPLFTAQSGRPYSYEIFGGPRLSGGHSSINGSGGAVYLPTIGRNTLRLPETANLDLKLNRTIRLSERVRVRASAEVFNVENRVNYTSITTRAYLVGTALNGVTPLIFQDAATVASEGLNVQPFGTYTAASSNSSRERQVQIGFKLEF